jgi:aspartate/methionine/tyrosine aminotransferase
MIIEPARRIADVGEYYFSQKLAEIAWMRTSGIDVINLGIGNPDQAPPEITIETMAIEARNHGNHGYQSYTGIPQLRAAFAAWYLKNFGIALNPENEILPLIGSKEGIMHISLAFLNPGDEVLIPDPGYPAYEAAAKIAEAKVIKFDLTEENGWFPNFDEIEKNNLSKVKLMWVNYPNMPSGARGSKSLFEELIAFAKKHRILIINDNPYSFILNDKPMSILSVEGAKDVALELNSLSKSHNMAGWRIGMVAGEAAAIEAILKVKSNMDSGMFKPTQLAAVQALQMPAEWYKKINEVYEKRKILAIGLIEKLGASFNKNQSGMFIWARVPENFGHSSDFSDFYLRKAGVFMTPGFIFGEQGKNYFRISLCSNEGLLLEAIERITKLKPDKTQ